MAMRSLLVGLRGRSLNRGGVSADLIRTLASSAGSGRDRKDGDNEDGNDDELDDLFSLEEETPEEEAQRIKKLEQEKEEARLKDEHVIEAMMKEEERKKKKELQLSTSLGEETVGKLASILTSTEKVLVDVGLPMKYAQISPHLLEVMRFTTVRTGKVFAYDAHLENHKESRDATALYNLSACDLRMEAKVAAQLIAGDEYYDKKMNHIKITSRRFETSSENRLYVLHLLERVIREARNCTDDKVTEKQLQDITTSWNDVVKHTSAAFTQPGIEDYLRTEYTRSRNEVMQKEKLTKEYLIHREVWASKEGITDASSTAQAWKQSMLKLQERPLKRVPKDFVEKKAGKFVPKDLRLY
eukprot:Plantae.Rhodophyta-Purpureofilum_apyrenoidigerum.ctg3432.p1 GENE.Plantae.Rhodophyta-Purpureofilum_apyrenoidigerum.ctg3432~~Plantae.Rhodophyta-Purpureofilum_apyrenoidigerum.ctg3432.p1  ORF type:complete len:356 (+),score=81.51 Plantae.Rhodophyta-Purpureofilum_apyrenoidigerum.ctg3432:199-1266(+)